MCVCMLRACVCVCVCCVRVRVYIHVCMCVDMCIHVLRHTVSMVMCAAQSGADGDPNHPQLCGPTAQGPPGHQHHGAQVPLLP